MSTDIRTHPKVVRISSALKAEKLWTVGALHSAWSLFDTHSVDGILDGYNKQALDDFIGLDGFASAMEDVGWLEETTQGLIIPGFEIHNGASAKRRLQDLERKRFRKNSALEAEKKRTREEKIREEIDNNILIPVTDSGDREPSEKSETILTFQTEGKPGEWHLTDYWLSDIQKLYPSLDCLGESRKALAWIKAKPTRRKTARGMEAFLTNWFNNATDGRRSNGHANGTARIAEGMSIKESVEQLARQKGII